MEAPQTEMSVVGRMLRVFYVPSQTFEAVSRTAQCRRLAGADRASRRGGDCRCPARICPSSTEGGQEAMQQIR